MARQALEAAAAAEQTAWLQQAAKLTLPETARTVAAGAKRKRARPASPAASADDGSPSSLPAVPSLKQLEELKRAYQEACAAELREEKSAFACVDSLARALKRRVNLGDRPDYLAWYYGMPWTRREALDNRTSTIE